MPDFCQTDLDTRPTARAIEAQMCWEVAAAEGGVKRYREEQQRRHDGRRLP